ncbi:MAG: zinc ribbon domain-containing protein [Balneolales bacterium]|nr:zinc ribbon domain-containing protein [Balneolales bacterium]
MPTYEYRREDGTTFEIIQKMSEAPLAICPETGQKVKRVVSGGGGVVYKGEGWYVTDYKNGGKKIPENEKGNTPPEPQKSDSKKADTSSSESA